MGWRERGLPPPYETPSPHPPHAARLVHRHAGTDEAQPQARHLREQSPLHRGVDSGTEARGQLDLQLGRDARAGRPALCRGLRHTLCPDVLEPSVQRAEAATLSRRTPRDGASAGIQRTELHQRRRGLEHHARHCRALLAQGGTDSRGLRTTARLPRHELRIPEAHGRQSMGAGRVAGCLHRGVPQAQ